MTAPRPVWIERLERVQKLTEDARAAALREDWPVAIQAADEAAREAELALRSVVNLARAVGGLSDSDVGGIRGTSASAVTQRFGSRQALLRDAMRAEWEAWVRREDAE